MRLMRAVSAGLGEMRGFFPRLWSILRQLGNEVVGFMFIALTMFFIFSANGLRDAIVAASHDPARAPEIFMPAFFVLLCGGFALSSFLRARRISREQTRQDG